MANRINKVENQYPEGIQKCAKNIDGDCYPADEVWDEESYSTTTTTQIIMTTKFPKSSYPRIAKRKLGSNHWDKIHEAIQGQKRDASECPTDYQLCPKSMNGGCCPSNRSCGASSCYLSSAAPASACGVSGYTACGIDAGGKVSWYAKFIFEPRLMTKQVDAVQMATHAQLMDVARPQVYPTAKHVE